MKEDSNVFRAAVITKDKDGGIASISQWLGASTADYEEAFKRAEQAVKVSGYNETAVLEIVTTVTLQRNVCITGRR